jgi:cholesterol transport system auxiliary component
MYLFSAAADPPATNPTTNVIALSRVAISPLFQSRSFTYRTGENAYKQDPYAGFMIPPERALGEAIRSSMRASGVFGHVVEPGGSLVPNLAAEVFINELYGDFRNPSQPMGKMELHFICYEEEGGAAGNVIIDKVYARETQLKAKTPDALMAAWDIDLREIMKEMHSEFEGWCDNR